MWSELVKPLRHFVTRDVLYIVGGAAVLGGVLSLHGISLAAQYPAAVYVVALGVAHAIGYALQDGFSLTPLVTTQAIAHPTRLDRWLYLRFEGIGWEQGLIDGLPTADGPRGRRSVRRYPDLDRIETAIYREGAAGERHLEELGRIITLQHVGATMGSCFLVLSLVMFARTWNPWPTGWHPTAAAAAGVLLLSAVLLALARVKAMQEMRRKAIYYRLQHAASCSGRSDGRSPQSGTSQRPDAAKSTETASARLLRGDWLDTYRAQLDLLWFQSVELNADLYLLEKIAEFPFDLFAGEDQLFWKLAADSFYESSVMVIWRIVGDSSSDALTLPQFRNQLVRHASDDQANETLVTRLRVARFDERIRHVVDEISQLRHEWIAHLKREAVSKAHEDRRGMPVIPLDRLKAVRDAVNQMIAALSLDTGRATTYMEYSGTVEYPPDMDARPDIDKILDHLADRSPALRMPETDPQFWEAIWPDLSDHERQQFSKYRQRLGLEPLDG